jgi:hypothetical protein
MITFHNRFAYRDCTHLFFQKHDILLLLSPVCHVFGKFWPSVQRFSFRVGHKFLKMLHLPVALYGCETWSPTLREEHRLKVFKNRFLRRIFGRKMDEVTGEWWKLQNEEHHNLYSPLDISRQIKSSKCFTCQLFCMGVKLGLPH